MIPASTPGRTSSSSEAPRFERPAPSWPADGRETQPLLASSDGRRAGAPSHRGREGGTPFPGHRATSEEDPFPPRLRRPPGESSLAARTGHRHLGSQSGRDSRGPWPHRRRCKSLRRAWASQETRRPGKPLPLPHRLAKEDLRHIPRGERGSPQNVFRDVYVIERLHGWKDHGSAQKALHDALEYMHKDHPDYPFRYDEAWFESRSGDAKEEHDR